MNQIIGEPILILFCLLLFIIIYSILIHLAYRKQTSNTVDEIFTILLFLILIGTSVSPLKYLNPSSLAIGTIQLGSATFISQLLFYPLFAFLMRLRVAYFYPGMSYLVRNPFLGTLLLITVSSALWSETPAVTFRASLVLLIYASLASYVAYRCSFQEVGKFLRLAGTFTTISGALTSLLVPSIGRMQDSDPELAGAWQGLLDHKNGFAFWMALTAALWLLEAVKHPKSRWKSIGLATLSLFVMIPARSGASKLMFFLMLSVLILSEALVRLRRLNIQKVAVITMFSAIFSGIFTVALLANQATVLSLLGKDASLTGRTEFWPQIIQAVSSKPFLGYGYEGFWQSWRGYENPARTIITASEFVPPHAHNGYLEILLATGFIGITLFALSLLLIFVNLFLFAFKARRGETETVLCMLIFLLLSSFSESKLWLINEYSFLFFLVSTRLSIEVTASSKKSINSIQLFSKSS